MINILEQASDVITGPRQEAYGPPNSNFERIADMWSTYTGTGITPHDVAMMMILLKVARVQTIATEDTLVDICGYAALASVLD